LQAGNSLSGEHIKMTPYIPYGKNVAVTYSDLLGGKNFLSGDV
jgi:hypothetical protein